MNRQTPYWRFANSLVEKKRINYTQSNRKSNAFWKDTNQVDCDWKYSQQVCVGTICFWTRTSRNRTKWCGSVISENERTYKKRRCHRKHRLLLDCFIFQSNRNHEYIIEIISIWQRRMPFFQQHDNNQSFNSYILFTKTMNVVFLILCSKYEGFKTIFFKKS